MIAAPPLTDWEFIVAWNQNCPPGQLVDVLMPNGSNFKTTTRSKAWIGVQPKVGKVSVPLIYIHGLALPYPLSKVKVRTV